LEKSGEVGVFLELFGKNAQKPEEMGKNRELFFREKPPLQTADQQNFSNKMSQNMLVYLDIALWIRTPKPYTIQVISNAITAIAANASTF